MLITEELFLLLTRDDGKNESSGTYVAYGLAGAVLADLILAGRLSLDDAKDPRMTVVSGPAPGHPVLDLGLEALEGRDGKRLSSMITGGRIKAEQVVGRSLEAAGVVTIEEKRLLGISRFRYPVADPGPEEQVRARLDSVLRGQRPADERDVAVLAILRGLDCAPKILGDGAGGLSRRELDRRIEELAASDPTGTAVHRSVQSMAAALSTAAIIPVITST